MTSVCPVAFEPMLLEKVWGGDRLGRFGKAVRAGDRIGESWEIADLRATSASGAGGGAKQSVVAGGEWAGKTLGDLVEAWGDDLVDGSKLTGDGAFPMLVKLLDAREHLSVQVHPSPAFAREHTGANLKTECWYVLDAEPGSVLYKGFLDGVTRADYERAIGDGSVASLLRTVPAVVGEMHDLPSGTIHALGAGVLVAEVQTPSDTTYRVHDWREVYDRPEREMHFEEALASTLFAEPPAPSRGGDGGGELVSNDFYRVSEVRGHCEQKALSASVSAGGCCVVMCVGGMGMSVVTEDGGELELRTGGCVLVPAVCAESSLLRMGPSARCLIAEVA